MVIKIGSMTNQTLIERQKELENKIKEKIL